MINIEKDTFGIEIIVDKALRYKKTARCPIRLLGHDKNNKKYLIVYAETETQKFFLQHSIIMQKWFEEKCSFVNCTVVQPLIVQTVDQSIYVIYEYIEGFETLDVYQAEKLMQEIYDVTSKQYVISEEIISLVEQCFLCAWPTKYHESIKMFPEYIYYFNCLKTLKVFNLGFSHGDYAINNVMKKNGKVYLLDFEFSCLLQPCGFEIYDFYNSCNKSYIGKNEKLFNAKGKLINKICDFMDNQSMPKVIDDKVNSQIHINETFVWQKKMKTITIEFENVRYCFKIYNKRGKVYIDIANRDIPIAVFYKLVDWIFQVDRGIYVIKVLHSFNDYDFCLNIDKGIHEPKEIKLYCKLFDNEYLQFNNLKNAITFSGSIYKIRFINKVINYLKRRPAMKSQS